MGKNDTIVAYTNLRESAIYFPFVIPVVTELIQNTVLNAFVASSSIGDKCKPTAFPMSPELLLSQGDFNRLLPEKLKSDKVFLKLIAKTPVWDVLNHFVGAFKKGSPSSPEKDKLIAELSVTVKDLLNVDITKTQSLELSWEALGDRYGLFDYPACISDDSLVQEKDIDSGIEFQNYRLSLMDANLIDVSTASWEQIFAIREDTESHAKLQRIRRLFSTDYEGKSQSFINDDLCQRLEDHEAAADKFGFEKKTTVMEAVCGSNTIKAGLASILGLAAVGMTEAAIASGALAFSLEAGNAAVKVRRLEYDFNAYMKRHPLGFIINAKKQLEGEHTSKTA